MLSIDFIRQNKELVKKEAVEKQLDPKVVDQLLAINKERQELIQEIEALRQQRKTASQKRDIETGKKIKEELGKLEPELKKKEEEYKNLMLLVPNISSPDTPLEDKEIYRWGKKPKFNFPPLSHLELGEKLDLIDLEKGRKPPVSGVIILKMKRPNSILPFFFMLGRKLSAKVLLRC